MNVPSHELECCSVYVNTDFRKNARICSVFEIIEPFCGFLGDNERETKKSDM